MRKSRSWGIVLLLATMMFTMHPSVATSSHSFRRVESHVWRSGAVNFNGRYKDFEVDGSEDHSLAWDLDGPCTILIEMVFPDGAGGAFKVAPADLGEGKSNPILVSGPEKNMIAIFVPVAPTLRVTVTGSASGVIVFSDS